MTANAIDLTDVATVAAYLSQDPSQDADLLQTLVTSISATIQTYLGRTLGQAEYTETRDGHGRMTLVLSNIPVTSIISLSVDGQLYIPGAYAFDSCAIYLNSAVFDRGWRNVVVSYVAGYTTIPYDIAEACTELVAMRYRLRDKTGLVSEAVMQQTTSYVQADMPSSVTSALEPYRRRIPLWT